jgi:hypothetical protein
MDCDSCGRYRPSAEIAPLLEADGRLVMACARCRQFGAGPSEPTTLAPITVRRPAPILATVVPRR